jgi:hypothetical protein
LSSTRAYPLRENHVRQQPLLHSEFLNPRDALRTQMPQSDSRPPQPARAYDPRPLRPQLSSCLRHSYIYELLQYIVNNSSSSRLEKKFSKCSHQSYELPNGKHDWLWGTPPFLTSISSNCHIRLFEDGYGEYMKPSARCRGVGEVLCGAGKASLPAMCAKHECESLRSSRALVFIRRLTLQGMWNIFPAGEGVPSQKNESGTVTVASGTSQGLER